MSFGVGIGDILLVTKIGFNLWVNFKGAPEEREELTAKLMRWKDKLEIIEPMLADVNLEPRAAKLAREEQTEALKILGIVDKLNRKLVKGKVLRQAAWEVRGRATFLEYQTRLEGKLQMLDMLLLGGSMKMVTDEVRETNIVLRRVENGMRDLGFLSPEIAPITFIDALGYQRQLPFDLCQQVENFRDIVSMCFKECAGKSFVERGEYIITDEGSGAPLRVDDWKVRPGMKLSMAIVIRKRIEKGKRDYKCPGCKKEYTGPIGICGKPERVNCTYCKRWFQISTEIAGPFGLHIPDGYDNQFRSNSGGPSNELIYIQRFHLHTHEMPDVSMEELMTMIVDFSEEWQEMVLLMGLEVDLEFSPQFISMISMMSEME